MKNNIKKFTAEIFNQDIGTNGVVIIQDNKVITEEYRQPYQKGEIHLLYSLTKSITALVIGIAIDKKIVSLDDTVVSFFLDKLPQYCSDNLNKMTIHNLLSMTTGRVDMDYYEISSKTDWVKAFLEIPVPYKPDSVHKYSSHTSHILSAIIKIKTGITLTEFANEYLFKPLLIDNYHWETWIDGNTVGGMGLSLATYDLAKIGQIILDKGLYNNKRILSQEYIRLATTNYIVDSELNNAINAGKKYGYSIEFHKGNFYHEGSFGQMLYIIPKQNIVIAINSRKREKGLLLNLINKYILQGSDIYNEYSFEKKSILPKIKQVPFIRKMFAVEIVLPHNDQNISLIRLDSDNKVTTYQRKYYDGKDETILFDHSTHKNDNLMFVKDTIKVIQPVILSSYWQDDNTLVFSFIYPETPYIVMHKFEFSDNDRSVKLSFIMEPSLGSLSANSPIDIFINGKIME